MALETGCATTPDDPAPPASGRRRAGRCRAQARATAIAAVLAALAIVAGTVAEAKDPKPAAAKPFDPKVDAALTRAVDAAGEGKFWGTVLVVRDGAVLWAKGFGTSDRAGKRGNDADTLFELASASKQFAATAILRLEQQKKLKTSDPLTKFFPGAPKDKKAVTLDHLLHHTAGLDPELGVPYAWPGDREDYLREILAKPLKGVPGAAFSYSNVGYALLAAVVEVVSKTTYEAYCRKELFGPAGLVDTGFIGDPVLVASPRAARREPPQGRDGATSANWWYGWGYRGMGGVVTTANDLVRWDRALRGEAVLGKAAKEKLFAPGLEDYACGWLVRPSAQGTKASHGGDVAGFHVMVSRWLDTPALVVVLSDDGPRARAVEARVALDLFALR